MTKYKDSNGRIYEGDRQGSDEEASQADVDEKARLDGWAVAKEQAQSLLNSSDITALRCLKAGVAFPATWQTYDAALRAIAGTTEDGPAPAMPKRPKYPAGT